MKNFKNIFFVGLLSILILASCAENKKESENAITIELNDGTSVLYDSGNVTIVSIAGWNDYNDADKVLYRLKEKNYEVSMESLEGLGSSIVNLQNSIPASLKTEEVLEDIFDVQEEYKKLILEKDSPDKNVKQNIEELVEKFDDLREELTETIEDYTE